MMLAVVVAGPSLALLVCPVVVCVLALAFFPFSFSLSLCGFFAGVVVSWRGCSWG